MSAYLVFLSILLGTLGTSALADRGTRESLLARFFPPLRHRRALAIAEGAHVVDLSDTVSASRRGIWRFTGARLVVLSAAVATQLLPPIWAIPAAAGAALYLVASGRDPHLVFELFGLEEADQPASRRQRQATVTAYAVKAALVFASLILIGIGFGQFASSNIAGLAWMGVGLALLWNCHVPARHIVQRGRTDGSAHGGFGIDASHDSVLFLRSFTDDRVSLRSPIAAGGPTHPVVPFTRQRFEEIVASYILIRGLRLVAIGRPGERLPELGATRTYYPDGDWQDAVRVTAARSQAIILVAGRSDGLAWEVSHLRTWGVLEKALFLLPPETSETAARERLTRLISHLDDEARVPAGWNMAEWIAVNVRHGQLRYIMSDGRDWASYLAALVGHFVEFDGTVASIDGSIPAPPTEVGKEHVSIAARMRILRALQRARKASEAGDRAQRDAAFEAARVAALDSGVRGASAWVRLAQADALAETGEDDDARIMFADVARRARDGFPRFYGLTDLAWMTAADIELYARSSLTTLATKSNAIDPRPVYIEYFEALQRRGKWSESAHTACVIGINERTRTGASQWFGRGVDAAARVGDLDTKASIELEWGEYLLERADPEGALEHLTVAARGFEQQADPTQLARAQAAIATAETTLHGLESGGRRFSGPAREWIGSATAAARERNDAQVEPAHFLHAIATDRALANVVEVDVHALTGDSVRFSREIEEMLGPAGTSTEPDVRFSPATEQLLLDVIDRHPAGQRIGPRDLLVAIVRAPEMRHLSIDWPPRPPVVAGRDHVDDARREPAPTTLVEQAEAPEDVAAEAEAAPATFRAVDWDLGWGQSPTAPRPADRPPGLTADPPMPPIVRRLSRACLIGILTVRPGRTRPWLLHNLARPLRARGYAGTAALIRGAGVELLADDMRVDEAVRAARELIDEEMPGWIDFSDDPVTAAEFRDALLQRLGELLWIQGDSTGRVEVERRRLLLAPTLRDPEAPTLAKITLAFALAQAGEHQEASELFAQLVTSDALRDDDYLMCAANALAGGDAHAAQHLLARAERTREATFPDAHGLKGDIAHALGDTERARAHYREGMSKVVEWGLVGAELVFRQRLERVGNVPVSDVSPVAEG